MLPAIFALSLLTAPLHGLIINLPPPTITAIVPASTNLSAGAEWPPVPWEAPYFYDECSLRFIAYGPEYSQRSRTQVVQGFDALIHQLLRDPPKTWGPRDLPLIVLRGVVNLHVIWLEEFSSHKLALTLVTIRDYMDLSYGPRDIAEAEFGFTKPTGKLVGKMEIRMQLPGPRQAAVLEG
ncbi:MAG: hypothetical protein Q9185_001568 [Variospora sp. 1 TL-2023]